MRLRRFATMSMLAVAGVVVSGSLGSGTGLAAAPETAPPPVAPAPVDVPFVAAPVAVSPSTPVVSVPRTEIVAHRGDARGALENTPAAVADAFYLGADSVEFDIVSTADGKPVVLHDPNLAKYTTNCTGLASQKSYRQIRKCRTKDGNSVPNLVEMLEQVPAAKGVYLHLKTPSGRGMARTLMAAVNEHGDNDRSVFFSSHPSVLEELRAAGAANLGLIFDNANAAWAWTSRYDVLIPYQTPVTAKLVRAAQAAGKLVVPVQARPTSMAQALRLGVDGFMVNDLVDALNVLG
ncbi:MAG: glycerophosphodiester phosphodiesterase [Sporichthyaceae bacterium]